MKKNSRSTQRQFVLCSVFLFLLTDAFALKPVKEYIAVPDASFVDYRENYIPIAGTNDSIISWFYSPKNGEKAAKTIVLSYGDSGNMSYMIDYAMVLTQMGYNVITYDYRGFGKSSALAINEKQLYYAEFIVDLKSVLDYYTATQSEIVLFGMSMGSYISVRYLCDYPSDQVKITTVIAEGLMINPEIITQELSKLGKNVVNPLRSEKLDLTPIEHLNKLVFMGESDHLINSQLAIDELTNNNWKIKKYAGGHLRGAEALTDTYYGDLYFREIADFLKQD